MIFKVPFEGLKDIYRVFDEVAPIKSIEGWKLLFETLMALICEIMLFTGLIFLVECLEVRMLSSLAKELLIFIIGISLTDNFTIFQNKFNPFSGFDYMITLTGRFYGGIDPITGKPAFLITNATGFSPYIIALTLGIIFLAIGILLPKKIYGKSSLKISKKSAPFSISDWESNKIIMMPDVKIGLVILAVFILVNFLSFLPFDKEQIGYAFSSDFYRKFKEREKRYVEKINKKSETPIPLVSDIDILINFADGRRETFQNRENKKFYDVMHDYTYEVFQKRLSPWNDRNHPTFAAQGETLAIFKKAIEMNVEPVVNDGLILSAYDTSEDFFEEKKNRETWDLFSHSAFLGLYRMLTLKRLDIFFLLSLILIAMGGYTYDKEFGNQPELLYTQPISRKDYHLQKLIASTKVCFIVLCGGFLFTFILGFITEGVGAWNFPVVVYKKNIENPMGVNPQDIYEYIKLIPMYQYLIRVFIVLIFQSFFLSTLSLNLSIFVREKEHLFLLTGLIMSVGYFLSMKLPSWIAILSPFSYLDASQVANNAIKAVKHIPNASFILSLAILAVWGVFFFIKGVKSAKRCENFS